MSKNITQQRDIYDTVIFRDCWVIYIYVYTVFPLVSAGPQISTAP